MIRWACCAGTRDFCSPLAAVVGPIQNYIFLIVLCSNSFVPIAQQAGQAAVLGRLSLCVCLWLRLWHWQSDTLTTLLDLIHNPARSHPQLG
jgi:hypothetical protein